MQGCTLLMLCTALCAAVHCSLAAAPVYGLDASGPPDDEDLVEFLIMLKRKGKLANEERWNQVKTFCENLDTSPVVSDVFIFHDVIVLSLRGTTAVLDDISQHEEVELIQVALPIRPYVDQELGAGCTEQDSGEELWGLSRTSVRQVEDYESATYIYASGDGQGVTVYVVDSGIYIDHAEFEGRAKHGYTARLMSGEGDEDRNGHGTHVAGTVAGKTYGMAKRATVVAVKVLDADGAGTSKTLLEGLQWVLQDYQATKSSGTAKGVVNMSLGVAEGQVDRLLEEVVHELIEEGLSVVVAAGNNQDDTCKESPARMSAVISVAATTKDDTLASFSNYGSCVDIMAPGKDILSAGIASTTATTRLQGTSMAAPHVAGVLARFFSQTATPISHSMAKSWLLDSATTGAIDVRSNVETPNKLLYMPCKAARGECIIYSIDTCTSAHGYGSDGGSDGFPTLLVVTIAGFAVLTTLLIVTLALLIRSKRDYRKKISSMDTGSISRPSTVGRTSNRTYDAVRSVARPDHTDTIS